MASPGVGEPAHQPGQQTVLRAHRVWLDTGVTVMCIVVESEHELAEAISEIQKCRGQEGDVVEPQSDESPPSSMRGARMRRLVELGALILPEAFPEYRHIDILRRAAQNRISRLVWNRHDEIADFDAVDRLVRAAFSEPGSPGARLFSTPPP